MSLTTLKIFKSTAMWSAKIGVLFLAFIVFFTMYRLVMNPAKIKNKNRWDLKTYFFLKKYHTKIAAVVIALFVYHAVFMSFYVLVRGKKFFPFFGFLATLAFLGVAISGVILYYKMRTSGLSVKQKRSAKISHLVFVILGVIFLFLHIIEIRQPIVKTVEKYQKIPSVKIQP